MRRLILLTLVAGALLAPQSSEADSQSIVLHALPTGDFTVVAAAPRADVTLDTGNNSDGVHTANGTDWYLSNTVDNGYWGFTRAGDGVLREQYGGMYTCDHGGVNGQGGNMANVGARMCWPIGGHKIAAGWRVGVYFGLDGWSGSSWSSYRALYVADSPSYYPSGPRPNVSQQVISDGGWKLCFSGTFMDTAAVSDVLAACQGKYLLMAGMAGYNEWAPPGPTVGVPSVDDIKISGQTATISWTPSSIDQGVTSYRVKLLDADSGETFVGCETLETSCSLQPQLMRNWTVLVVAVTPDGEGPDQRTPTVLVPAGTYPYPMDAKSDSQGNMYVPVSDNGGRDSHFEKVTPSGVRTRILDVGFHWWPDHVSLAITPDDQYMYFTDQDQDPFGCGFRLVRVDLSTLSQTSVATGLCAPNNVAIDRNGDIYLTSGGRAQAARWWRFDSHMKLIGETTQSEHDRIWNLNHQDAAGNSISYDGRYLRTQAPRYLRIATSAPSIPRETSAQASPESAAVTWSTPTTDGGTPITSYTVTASPGGASCTTSALSCTVTGLTNRQRYTFTVTATNAAGASEPSAPSNSVMPLAPGFQAWTSDVVVAVGSSTSLNIAQAVPGSTIAVTGGMKATVVADLDGFGSTSYVATKAGTPKVTAAYVVKAGRTVTKYTATTQVYVPYVSGPVLRLKSGRDGRFKVSYAPPGAQVVLQLSDGRSFTEMADGGGKVAVSVPFSKVGAVNYTVTVADVLIETGGLTVTR